MSHESSAMTTAAPPARPDETPQEGHDGED